MAVGILTALLSTSSLNDVFVSINQFQLYILIPLTGAYIHKNLLNYISGFKFATFNFDNIIDFKKVVLFKYVAIHYDDTNSDSYLNSIDIKYRSAFRNSLSLLFIFSIIIIIHIIIVIPLY